MTVAYTASIASAEALLPEVQAFRARFPIFRDKVHLANNAMGAIADTVEIAHRQFLDDRIRYGASWEVAQEKLDRLRQQFATLIGAKANEIAVCFSATQALGVLSTCFNWQAGDCAGL